MELTSQWPHCDIFSHTQTNRDRHKVYELPEFCFCFNAANLVVINQLSEYLGCCPLAACLSKHKHLQVAWPEPCSPREQAEAHHAVC